MTGERLEDILRLHKEIVTINRIVNSLDRDLLTIKAMFCDVTYMPGQDTGVQEKIVKILKERLTELEEQFDLM